MAHIEPIAKPRGASERYQFFRNKDTGHEWKALLELKTARAAMISGDVETAPINLAVTVTVSPIENNGKAKRDNGNPIIIDSWTHTFNSFEMEQPNFNPEARILQIVAERIHVGEAHLSGNEKLKEFVGKWGGKNKLKVAPVVYERKD